MLFLLFQLGSDFYALDAREIVEVLPLVNIRKSLSLPQQFAGTINYRGAFVPVVDLSELILGRGAPRRTNTRIILARYATEDGKPMLVGLIAENATATMRKEPTDFVASGISNHLAPYLGPIAMGPQGAVQRIELNKLLAAFGRASQLKEPA